MKAAISGYSQVAKYQAPITVSIFRSHWSLGLIVVDRDSPTKATAAQRPRRVEGRVLAASGLPEHSIATSTPSPSVSARSRPHESDGPGVDHLVGTQPGLSQP